MNPTVVLQCGRHLTQLTIKTPNPEIVYEFIDFGTTHEH